MNMNIKRCLAVLFVILLASAVQAKTYYYIGSSSAGDEDLILESKAGGKVGWAESSNATQTVYHKAANGNDYVIPEYSGANYETKVSARIKGGATAQNPVTLPGNSLTLRGSFALKGDFGHYVKLPPVIADGGQISEAADEHFVQVMADFSVAEGRKLSFTLSCNATKNTEYRSLEIGAGSQNTLTGGGSIYVGGKGGDLTTKNSYVDFKADMSGFTGAIKRHDTYPTGPRKFILKISDKFAGSIESLPDNTEQVQVSFDGVLGDKGLRVSSTTVPPALKTKLVFHSATADFTVKNLPLMTFPVGTGLEVSDFTVKHAETKGGSATAFENLGVRVNDDGAMTLCANYEGQVVELNSWTIEPALSKTAWMEREDEPGALTTQPEAKFGNDTMTVTLNGEPWDGTMPTAVGSYTLTWSVAATESYTGISASRSFAITSYVNPINSPVRYFSSASAYWKGALTINDALLAMPSSGGIIEVNQDVAADAMNCSYAKGSIVVRSCTDPSKAGRRFTVKRLGDAVADLPTGGNLVISNVCFLSEGRNASLFDVKGGNLTLGEGVELRAVQPADKKGGLVSLSAAAGTLRIEGAILTNSTVAVPMIDLSAAHAHTVSIGLGSVIEGNRTVGNGFGGKGLLVDLSNASQSLGISGGSLANNTIASGSSGLIRATAGLVNLSGSPVVYGNVKSDDGSQANVVPSNADIVKLAGALEKGSKIGVRYGAKDENFGTVTGQGLTLEVARLFKNDLTPTLLGSISGSDLVWRAPGLVLILR